MDETDLISMSENATKLSHKKWRQIAKKCRRRKLRQKIAKERDDLLEKQNSLNMKNPAYLTWLAEQRVLELCREESEQHSRNQTQQQWLEYDRLVQERWKIKQEKLAKIEATQEQQRIKIREEFEAKQTQEKNLREEKIRLVNEKLKQHEKLSESIKEYIDGIGDLPSELNVKCESNPGKAACPFFEKTSTCRYGMKCSRNHCRPGISRLLLIPNFFSHIRLEQSKHTEYGSDFSLEIDDAELNKDFTEFFNDVEPELARFGKIFNFCVCSNQEPHLRGHTYVEYDDQRNALKAYRHLQGRYYAGRMLNVEFSQMISWRSAVCGLSFANKCPKGRNCNFLHIFKNPRNCYPLFSQQRSNVNQQKLSTTRRTSPDRKQNEERKYLNWDECDDDFPSNKRCWRWTVSPENRSTIESRSMSRSRHEHRKRSPQQSSKVRSRSRSKSKRDSKSERESKRESERESKIESKTERESRSKCKSQSDRESKSERKSHDRNVRKKSKECTVRDSKNYWKSKSKQRYCDKDVKRRRSKSRN